MGLRSWFKRAKQRDDDFAARRDAGSEYESDAERAFAESSREGRAADERVLRRAGLDNVGDLDRMGSGE